MKIDKLPLIVIGLLTCACSTSSISSIESSEEGSSFSSEENIVMAPNFTFEDTPNGKKLVIEGKFDTGIGAFGLQTGIGVDLEYSPIYSTNYSSVRQEGDKYYCEASATTDNGSTVKTIDIIYQDGDRVIIDREFSVVEGDSKDLGFAVYFQIEDVNGKDPYDYEWFLPSSYFGNEEKSFYTRAVKSYYQNGFSVVSNDSCAFPLLMCYDKEEAFSLMDISDGLCETTFEDLKASGKKFIVDERINIGGIGIKEVTKADVKHSQLFSIYPSGKDVSKAIPEPTYRLLPLTKGLTRTMSFSIGLEKHDTFFDAINYNYRYGYEYYKVVDKRYAAKDVYQKMLEYIDRSFGYIDNIPQYMCNSDHHCSDSGFLHRNSDLAYVMLSAGRKQNNQKWIDDALTVLADQLKFDRLDTGLVISDNPYYTLRASMDAFVNLIHGYDAELAKGFKHNDWARYLINKAEGRMTSTKWTDAVFFSQMGLSFKSNIYMNKAIELLNDVKGGIAKFYASGTLSDTDIGLRSCEKEGGILALTACLNVYEYTKDPQWLHLAECSAMIVEAEQYIRPVMCDVYDSCGFGFKEDTGKAFEHCWHGNGRFLSYGMNFIGYAGACADNCGLNSSPDFYRLYLASGDKHYLSFYEYLTYNSVLYSNMGDKVGSLDDLLYSSGYGFQNEYYNATNSSYTRGTAHNSNLGWNMFAALSNYEKVNNIIGGDEVVPFDDVNRDFDIKKNKYTRLSQDGYVTDLLELCHVSDFEGYEGEVEYSLDNVTWKKGTKDFNARYVRFPSTVENIKKVKIIGLPITVQALNYTNSATNCSDANFATAQDWNYSTTYELKSKRTITIDLGEEHTITEIALKSPGSLDSLSFDVLVSKDGVNYEPYASFTDYEAYVHVHEAIVDQIRYVQLKSTSLYSMNIKEFKVFGI